MANTTAARRYAKALFALSREQQATEQVCRDLAALVALMDTSHAWHDFVLSPVGSPSMRAQIIQAITGGKLAPLSSRFLLFIDEKRRFSLLPAIYTELLALCDADQGILRATVYSATTLTPAQATALAERLSTRFGKNVLVTPDVDPRLIGGFKVFIADQVFDFSIATQLEQLKKRMMYA